MLHWWVYSASRVILNDLFNIDIDSISLDEPDTANADIATVVFMK
jgi:hypothetical protein